MSNLACLDSWEIRKCLRLALAILLANLGLVVLAALGLDIPILRQIVGFIFLTFIPGILILRILKIHNVGAIESLLYSVGLSIAFVMFSGLFANFVLPLIGVSKPISLLPITATLGIFTLILGAVAYKRDRDFAAEPKQFNIAKYFSPPYLFLLVLPLLAILGAHLVNLYQNNFLLLFFVIAIGCVVVLAAFDRLPRNAYPLAIVMIGLSLLLHISLISSQLSGHDINIEYYFQNLVAQSGYWSFTIVHDYNTALSIVMLNPIYSLLLNMDAIWAFKVVYPLIFCLVPLALLHVFRGQIGEKKAFFAAFFFVATPMFVLMTAGVRNQIAQLFLALLILLLTDRKLALIPRMTLAIIFTFSLIVSHYASAYIALYLLIIAWVIVALIRSRAGKRAWGWLTRKSGGLPEGLASQWAFPHKIMAVIIGVYLALALIWYGGIAQGAALSTITNIVQTLYSQLRELIATGVGGSLLFDPMERDILISTALGLDFSSASPLGKVFRIFQYSTQLFIVLGFACMILKPKGFKFKPEFIALSVGAALILLACVVLPRFSAQLGAQRFYHLSLFLLAPLCISGGEFIWQSASKVARSVSSRLRFRWRLALSPDSADSSPAYLRFLALAILIPYFLFNSGFIAEVRRPEPYVPNDIPHSQALSSYRLDMRVFNQKEADAVGWLAERIDGDTLVYADEWGKALLFGRLYDQVGVIRGEVPNDAYIFLRTWNVEQQELHIVLREGAQGRHVQVSLARRPALLEGRRLIYDNGGAQIWSPHTMTD